MVTNTDFGLMKPTQIQEEMRVSYLDYAMSVIVSRALPDMRDGLKPVQRRILYAMHDMGMRPNSSYKKSARLVGEVLGKYHPHGDSAVYAAMVRMAQDFSMRMPLVDGQGNFGSIDDDPPAAMRYTEARLNSIAEEMLANLDQDTVDFSDNFDASLREPTVLPTKLPNLLVNGGSGIAVGMATNIPPHNPSEVCNAIIRLIDKPDATTEELMRHIKGPDFPTGATIMGREGIANAYETGRGQIIVRATAEIETVARTNRTQIVISELPYQVNKATLVERIASLMKERRLSGISEVRDESNREGMRIVLDLQRGTQGLVILNNLYKLTSMQTSFSANMLALIDGTPRVFTLHQALYHFIEFRKQVVTRRSEYQLTKARERAHILTGLRIALGNLDEVIALIRSSKDAETAKNELVSRFGLDLIQSQAILDMQLRRIAALERERLEKEYQELQETIRWLEELLADSTKILDEIKQETRELKKKFGQPRRTGISNQAYDFDREELEPHERVVVTLSQGGYIKRIAADTYKNQHRGGKGVMSMKTKEDDPVKHILVVDTHDRLLFLTNRGRVLSLKSYELRADMSRNTRGVPVMNVIPLTDDERVNALISVESLTQEDTFIIMGTRNGSIKRMSLNRISSIRPSGLIIMNLKPDDELVEAKLATIEQDAIIVSQQGMSIRFPITDIPTRLRAAGGVRGMKLRSGDKVVGMDVAGLESRILVISKMGYGKVTVIDKYRRQGRGGFGVKTFNITSKTGPVAAAEVVNDSTQVYVVSEQAQVLRTNLVEIRSMGRITQGVTIFKPQSGDSVSSIACVSDLDSYENDSLDKITNLTSPNSNGKGNGQMPLKELK